MTTYALPFNGSITHGHGHSQTQNQGLPQERFLSQHDARDTSPTRKETPTNNHHTHLHTLSNPNHNQSHFELSNHQRFKLNSQLSAARSGTNGHVNGGVKGMEYHINQASVTVRPRGNSYGFPKVQKGPEHGAAASSIVGASSRRWLLSNELIASLLIPLPYLLVSFAYPKSPTQPISTAAKSGIAQLSDAVLNDTDPPIPAISISQTSVTHAFALTAGTLLALGLVGRIHASHSSLDRRKRTLGVAGDTERKPTKMLNAQSTKRIVSIMLSVSLPLYASLKLGGERSGLAMLIAGAGGLVSPNGPKEDLSQLEGWKRLVTARKWTLVTLVMCIIGDVLGFTSREASTAVALGYVALALSFFVLPPPFSRPAANPSEINALRPTSAASTSAVPATPWDHTLNATVSPSSLAQHSPLISTVQDTNLTLVTGLLSFVVAVLSSILSPSAIHFGNSLQWAWFVLAIAGGASSLVFAQPAALNRNPKFGFLIGSALSLFTSNIFSSARELWGFRAMLVGLSYIGVRMDRSSNNLSGPSKHTHHHHVHVHDQHLSHRELNPSKLTTILLNLSQRWPLLHSILAEKDSRRIFYFMSLNFAFMVVQFSYGLATHSLGLLSDSIHMAFDCLALAVGLCAAVMSKWPPSIRFPYGYGKMDTLAGFANGIFLMLISIEIVAEAMERLAEGTDLQRIGELLIVSTIGLVVNLIGIMAFDHAHHGHGHSHGHSHGGHSHGHEHSHAHAHAHAHAHEEHNHSEHTHHNHDENSIHAHYHPGTDILPPATPSKPTAPHSHGHGHHHHHHNSDNMHGIFLHILADTLGSVAVVISTLLVHFYGWSGFDPLASFFIAVMIFASAVPLVISSAKTLLLTVPADVEYSLRDTLAGVSGLRGVVAYSGPRFWVEDSGVPHDELVGHGHGHGHDGALDTGEPRVLGVMHVVAARTADVEDVRVRTVQFLKGRGMDVVVQVERE